MSEQPETLPWYGGNKIPDSYLAKFLAKTQDDDKPYDLRLFLNQMGMDDIDA